MRWGVGEKRNYERIKQRPDLAQKVGGGILVK